MRRTRFHRLVLAVGVLLSLLGGVPALAQVAAEPDTVRVTLAPDEATEVGLTLTNTGSQALALVLAPQPAGEAEGTLGEVLFTRSFDGTKPYDLTMTPEGRLFVSDEYSSLAKTWEYAPDLSLVRSFEHPRLAFFSFTWGIAWMPPEYAPAGYDDGTLWWLDVESHVNQGVFTLDHAILIEGDLDGEPTGRQVEITHAVGPAAPPHHTSGFPTGLSYDPETELFYYLDAVNEKVWAITVEGEVAEGYPVPQSDYDTGEPTALRGEGIAAHHNLLEVIVGRADLDPPWRVVVTDRDGTNTGTETPLTSPEPNAGFYGVVRSPLNPSILYVTVVTGGGSEGEVRKWVYAVRGAPLPPCWLRVTPVAPEKLTLGVDETVEVLVDLDAGELELGTYGGAIVLREGDTDGDVLLRVQVTLTVTEETNAEDEPVTAAQLSVYPNPSQATATVALSLAEASEVEVIVYDVLGRRVAVLHDGPLGAGEHALDFDAAGLPAGVYLVRAEGDAFSAARRLTVLR